MGWRQQYHLHLSLVAQNSDYPKEPALPRGTLGYLCCYPWLHQGSLPRWPFNWDMSLFKVSVRHHKTHHTRDFTVELQVKTGSGPGFPPQEEVSLSIPEKVTLGCLCQGTCFSVWNIPSLWTKLAKAKMHVPVCACVSHTSGLHLLYISEDPPSLHGPRLPLIHSFTYLFPRKLQTV